MVVVCWQDQELMEKFRRKDVNAGAVLNNDSDNDREDAETDDDDISYTAWYDDDDNKRNCIAVNGIPSHSYGVSLAIWDRTVLPATRHKWAHPALTPAIKAGTQFTYLGGMEGWVDLGDLLHTEMVYPPAGGHPSEY